MEALQKELYKYFRERIDVAMKEEIANRAISIYKFHEVYSCYLPHDDIYTRGADPLQRAIINAINEVIEEWRTKNFDIKPFYKDDYYGVYWN